MLEKKNYELNVMDVDSVYGMMLESPSKQMTGKNELPYHSSKTGSMQS